MAPWSPAQGDDTQWRSAKTSAHLAAEPRTQVRWIRGDMRRLRFRSECANATIMMDAFGFFDIEEEHEEVARGRPRFDDRRTARVEGREWRSHTRRLP